MRQPAQSKPEAAAETARVIAIFDWLMGELDKRGLTLEPLDVAELLAVAERIAARTSA